MTIIGNFEITITEPKFEKPAEEATFYTGVDTDVIYTPTADAKAVAFLQIIQAQRVLSDWNQNLVYEGWRVDKAGERPTNLIYKMGTDGKLSGEGQKLGSYTNGKPINAAMKDTPRERITFQNRDATVMDNFETWAVELIDRKPNTIKIIAGISWGFQLTYGARKVIAPKKTNDRTKILGVIDTWNNANSQNIQLETTVYN